MLPVFQCTYNYANFCFNLWYLLMYTGISDSISCSLHCSKGMFYKILLHKGIFIILYLLCSNPLYLRVVIHSLRLKQVLSLNHPTSILYKLPDPIPFLNLQEWIIYAHQFSKQILSPLISYISKQTIVCVCVCIYGSQ